MKKSIKNNTPLINNAQSEGSAPHPSPDLSFNITDLDKIHIEYDFEMIAKIIRGRGSNNAFIIKMLKAVYVDGYNKGYQEGNEDGILDAWTDMLEDDEDDDTEYDLDAEIDDLDTEMVNLLHEDDEDFIDKIF